MYPQTSSLCCNQASPLSGAGLDFSSFFKRLTAIWGGEWEKAINEIEMRVVWNDRKFIDNFNPFATPNITRPEVEKTVASYINYHEKNSGKFPYWNANLNETNASHKAQISEYSKLSGVNSQVVKKVLDQLYWATKDGSIKTDRFLYPGNREFDEYTKTPDSANAVDTSIITSPIEGITWILRNAGWILPTALIGAGLFIAYPYLKTAQEYTKK